MLTCIRPPGVALQKAMESSLPIPPRLTADQPQSGLMPERSSPPTGPVVDEAARITAELLRPGAGTDPFAAAVRATRMPMIITDPRQPDNPVVFANGAFCRLTGYAREDILGRNCRFLQGPDTDRDAVARVRQAVAEARSIEIDLRNYRKDGSPFWNRLLLAPVRNAQGELTYFFASQVDVTLERERLAGLETRNAALAAEVEGRKRELEQSEARLRFATEAGGMGVWELDPLTGTLAVSTLWRRLFGLPDAAARPMLNSADMLSAIDPADRATVAAALARAIGSDGDMDVEFGLAQPSDGARWIQVRARGLTDADSGGTRVAGVALDVTRRKEADIALKQLAGDLETRVQERTRERDRIWRNSPDLLTVIDGYGVLHAVNPAWEALLGYRLGELAGTRLADLAHPDDVPLSESALADADARGLSFTARLRHRDGTHRWFAWTGAPYEGLIYAVGRDVTAEHEAAETLRRTEEALRQSQKMEAVGQLTGGLAHDFNNLLTGIEGSLELLATRLGQGRYGELERYVSAARGAASRAAALTHRLLAFSRRQTLAPEPVVANRLIAGMEDLIRRTIGPGVELAAVLTEDLWTTLCDPNQLENALLNLCLNARDAMPDGGRLTIETANTRLDAPAAAYLDIGPGEYVTLSVSDTGAGMTPEVRARAFDPFFTTKPLGQGTGLGLSMTYGFARQSGGHARIYSEPGHGTTVKLYLPRHRGSTETTALPAAHPGATDSDLSLAERRTVLVVDDEPTIRMLVREVLDEIGLDTVEATDGAEALAALQASGGIDLLVTDVGLPGGMNGRQLADAARTTRPGLGVLFITGYAENAALRNGVLEPGMQVITKPFAMAGLSARVRDMLRNSRGAG